MPIKKYLPYALVLLLTISFSCKKDTETKKTVKTSEKPIMKYLPKDPFILKYSLDKYPNGKKYIILGSIDINFNIIPNIEKQKEYIEVFPKIKFESQIIKTNDINGVTYFDYRLKKLIVYSGGPGVSIDYNSENNEKILQPQLKWLDSIIDKPIPFSVDSTGKIDFKDEEFFNNNKELRGTIKDEIIEKIKTIISYSFINYPTKNIKIKEIFRSDIPFKATYSVEAFSKDKSKVLITPQKTIDTSKNIIANSISGWLEFDVAGGMLKKNHIKYSEKKYIHQNSKKVLTIINTEIKIGIKE